MRDVISIQTAKHFSIFFLHIMSKISKYKKELNQWFPKWGVGITLGVLRGKKVAGGHWRWAPLSVLFPYLRLTRLQPRGKQLPLPVSPRRFPPSDNGQYQSAPTK
jgi:hypothetical protein